jgi:hypothetical protein
MSRRFNPSRTLRNQSEPEAAIPRGCKLFVAISTAVYLGLAGGIALWFPQYSAIAWALVLFSAHSAGFVLVQQCRSASESEGP